MKPRVSRLGSTDLEVSAVGLGTAAFGGSGWSRSFGTQADATSISTMRHAVGLGVTWVDTAPVYGLGHAEEVVGRCLRMLPVDQRPLVFTKGGLVLDLEHPNDRPQRSLKPASVRHEVDASLGRLGIERIDVYQFHWPDETGTPAEDSWGEVSRLLEEGKVRAAGVCNFGVDLLAQLERIRHVDSLQVPFSLIRREAAADVIAWAASHRTAVIAYSPMEAGQLTDTFSANSLAADDYRRTSRHFTEPALTRNLALRDALRPIAARHETSVAAIALAWTLSWPGVTAAVVGARTPPQVDGWIDGGTVRLGPDDLDAIEVAIRVTGAGSGPTRQ